MHSLIAERQRLFALPDQPMPDGEGAEADLLDLVDADGRVRTLVVGVAAATGWGPVAALCAGVDAELALPPPAVAVAGAAGFQVWFSLAEPVTLARAADFLAGLRARLLADVPDARLVLAPLPAGARSVRAVPALDAASGRWSAFIDPGLGGMFADEPWLDMAPGLAQQAELLAGVRSIATADFTRALACLAAAPEPDGTAVVPAMPAPMASLPFDLPARAGGDVGMPPPRPDGLGVGSGFADPRSFLLAVMNDPTARAEHRIDAAKALLPYFSRPL